MKDSVDDLLQQWAAAIPGIDARADGIVTRMQLLVRYLSERKADVISGLGLQMWECATLYALRRRGVPYAGGPTELARELGVTGAAMTSRLDSMVRRGYVARKHDRTDRRRNVVALTVKGLALSDRIIAVQLQIETELVSVLSESQQEQLTTLLRRLMQVIDEQP